MNLKTLGQIDQLLDDRLYVIKTLEGMSLTEVDCLSVVVSSRLSCDKAIKKRLRGVNREVGIIIYDEIVTELNDIERKLLNLGVDIEITNHLDAHKKATMDALKSNQSIQHFENMRVYHVGIPEGEQMHADPTDKYKEVT